MKAAVANQQFDGFLTEKTTAVSESLVRTLSAQHATNNLPIVRPIAHQKK
jgi:hypothetical protein